MKTGLILAALAMAIPSANAGTVTLPALVAACTGCHPASGGDPALPKLAGRDAGSIVAAMDAFRSGDRPATVMDRIARGISHDEASVIAAWYAAKQ